jgi:hypothetical protein
MGNKTSLFHEFILNQQCVCQAEHYQCLCVSRYFVLILLCPSFPPPFLIVGTPYLLANALHKYCGFVSIQISYKWLSRNFSVSSNDAKR